MTTRSTDYDLVVRGRVLGPAGETDAEVGVTDGQIIVVEPLGADLRGAETFALGTDEVLLPGLVDSHVHVNEPGRTEWEGFASATRAAAAGGVTTIVDMPLNSIPPTCDVDALEVKQAAARDQAFVDVGFWGGAIPGNGAQLRPLHDAGVFGFKCFLLPSGVDEFPPLDPAEMEADMTVLAGVDSMLIVHAEDAQTIEAAPAAHGRRYAEFLASRPPAAENTAIEQVIEAARRTGVRAHILHLSSAEALPMIRAARADGVRLSVETCPHYLTLAAEDIPDGATAFKCCPPIRGTDNRDRLWEALIEGTIDCVVSDHSPSTVDLKDPEHGDFGVAWGGVASLQLGLALVWTEARRLGIGLDRVLGWMATGPAALVGLTDRGRLQPGTKADFSIFAPEETFVVEPARLHHKNPITAYASKPLTGVVRRTFLHGRPVGAQPTGQLLRRPVSTVR